MNEIIIQMSSSAKWKYRQDILVAAIKKFAKPNESWSVDGNSIVKTWSESTVTDRTVGGFFQKKKIQIPIRIEHKILVVSVSNLIEDIITVTSADECYDNVAKWIGEQFKPFWKETIVEVCSTVDYVYKFGWSCKYCGQVNIENQVKCVNCGAPRRS